MVTVIKYGTSITDLKVFLKEGEFRCNIDDLTPLDVEVTHNNQGEGEIVISQDSYSKIQEKLFEQVPVDSLLGGVPPSNVMCPAFLFLTSKVC